MDSAAVTEKKGSSDHDAVESDMAAVVLRDGLKLHPQPTSDPLDPLNWSTTKKNSVLAIVMAL